MKVYPLDELLRVSKYLLNVEDKISPGFFIGVRDTLKMLVNFRLTLSKFEKQGVKLVALSYGPDIQRSIDEPYFEYYVWLNRLRTLKKIKAVA